MPPGLSQTALDIITSALRLLKVAESGESITPEEAADGLDTLNQMIDAWQIDKLTIFTLDIKDFPYVPGKQVYTLGTGGDFDTPRPSKIENASSILGASASNPLELPITYTLSEAEWQSVMIKSVSTTFPWICYDSGDMPFRSLHFWPIPADAAQSVRLYMWQPLSQFPDLTTAVVFPPGYFKAIRYNLAVDLSPEYPDALEPGVLLQAQNSLMRIKSANLEVPKLTCDDVSTTGGVLGATGLTSDIPPVY